MRKLTSERKAVRGTKPRQPRRTIRVLPITDYGGRRTRYYLNNWPLPVPAWMRHLDGWGVGMAMLALLIPACVISTSIVAIVMLLRG